MKTLGFFGAGDSRTDAQTALDDAKQALLSVRAAAYMFPKAAWDTRAWDSIGPLESGLQQVRDSFEKAPPIITFWGYYTDKGRSYRANFQALENTIRGMAVASGEAPQAVPPEVNGPAGPGGGTDDIPWGMLGVIAVVGIVLWASIPKPVASRSNG